MCFCCCACAREEHAFVRNWPGQLAHLVAREAVGAQLRLEVPDHDAVVQRARDELLHVGVEHHARHGVLVPAERPLQHGVLPLRRGRGVGGGNRN